MKQTKSIIQDAPLSRRFRFEEKSPLKGYMAYAIQNAIEQENLERLDDVNDYDLEVIYEHCRIEAGARLIANSEKAAELMAIRYMLKIDELIRAHCIILGSHHHE